MDNENKKKGINRNVILIILAVPILVALGVVAGSFLSDPDMQWIKSNEAKAETLTEETVPLEEFVLNLEPANNLNRYLRMEVSLSTTQEEGVETIDSNLDKIRDIIIHTVSSQSAEEIFDDETGTFALKNLLKTSINDTFEDEVIHQVYITNIVMQ